MLVLTRKPTESILIAPQDHLGPSMTVGELFAARLIEIVVEDVAKGQARLGIQAPRCLRVNREEVEARRVQSFKLAEIVAAD